MAGIARMQALKGFMMSRPTRPAAKKLTKNPTRRVGRPTDYTPADCIRVEELMARGLRLQAAAGLMGITRQTAHNWQNRYPEFFDSVQRGQAKRTAILEIELLSVTNSAVVRAQGTSHTLPFHRGIIRLLRARSECFCAPPHAIHIEFYARGVRAENCAE